MEKINHGVYSIKHKGKLLYIGSSNDLKRRKKEHIRKLQQGKHQKKLQKYIDENVKDLNDLDKLEFELIHQTIDDSKIRLFFAEMICILIYKPICNNAVFQVGLKYISLGKPVIKFDEDILKYL